MDFLKYDIKDNGAFAPFISTMEGAGADIDGSGVMFESDNSAAKMLADTLVEYEIMAPAMEAGKKAAPAAGGETPAPAPAAASAETKPAPVKKAGSAPKKVAPATAGAPETKKAVAKKAATGTAPKKTVAKKAAAATAAPAAGGAPAEKAAPADGGAPKEKAADDVAAAGVVAGEPAPKAADAAKDGEKADPAEDPNKQEVYKNIIEKIDSLGLNDSMKRLIKMKVVKLIDSEAAKDNTVYSKLVDNPMTAGKIVIGVIQKTNPQLFETLKEKGVLNEKGQNTVSVAQKSELGEAMKKILGQVEVPDAFNVEVDDSEWENALITSCGYPMINLTSPLVRDMLRAPDPSQQKRAYKAFKKQLGADPDVAKALAIGIKGNLGVGGKQEDAKTDMNAKIGKTESVGTEGEVLVEGPLSAIKNAFLNPVEVLRGIAQNKGTACHRNNLVVMYDDIDGKSGEGNDLVKVVPLGVSSGVLVDLNKSVQVPMSHLAAFYSVVDPKVSFKSYAKAMAEVNKKNENAHTSVEGKARMLGKKILSKVPLFGKGAKADLAAQDNNELMTAMGELAEYIQSNGHPPFYLLKPKSNPKEVDHWSDEKAANGYQMIIINQNGHKAGIILKKSVAEALFKVG
jgi:hypothetical protein